MLCFQSLFGVGAFGAGDVFCFLAVAAAEAAGEPVGGRGAFLAWRVAFSDLCPAATMKYPRPWVQMVYPGIFSSGVCSGAVVELLWQMLVLYASLFVDLSAS